MPPTTKSPQRKNAVARARRLQPVLETEDLPEEPTSLRETLKAAIRARRNRTRSVLLNIGVFAVGLLIGFLIWGYKPTPKPVVYNIETAGFPSLGPADAPIVIVEYSDYQCPVCYRWYAQVLKPLLAAYPGKIRFVYRNYPLSSIHDNAFASAEAALCAGDQAAYWEYHNTLFDYYPVLYQKDGTILDQATYNQFASSLGLNVATFEECMTSHKYEQFIREDAAYADSLPRDKNGEPAVGGTPTFFVNGQRLGGAYPLEAFREIIDEELKKTD